VLQVVTRYRLADDDVAFRDEAAAAVAVLAQQEGYVDGSVARGVDEPDVWVVETRWSSVGDFRRALSAFDVKVSAVPLLSRAVDEPSVFEVLHRRDARGPVDSVSDRAR
jgi:hypothetical protein